MTTVHAASLASWRGGLVNGDSALVEQLSRFYDKADIPAWRRHYAEALDVYALNYGEDSEVVMARCPGQMNIMGMHIDYGGMASLRLAVRGADTITVAGRVPSSPASGRVRMASVMRDLKRDESAATGPGCTDRMSADRMSADSMSADRFEALDFDIGELVPEENVGDRQTLMEFAGRVCSEREARTGSALDDHWGILPKGQLIFLESFFRRRVPIEGFDALVWSNVSPSGGMSSSSALVISTAFATLGLHGLTPGRDMSEEDLVDGIGTSEWIRGTRGGTADHGGMILGHTGELVSVGVFPAGVTGRASVPPDYVAIIIDSGVPRVYDEAGKEETVIAYPLGTFLVRDVLLPARQGTPGWEGLHSDYADRIDFIRDINSDNLGVTQTQIYQLLAEIPMSTTLGEVEAMARTAGAGEAYERMHRREVGDRFPLIGREGPILKLRRRFAFGLAEQDRVRAMVKYMNAGDMGMALELVRISHAGDRDTEVSDDDLARLVAVSRKGVERAALCFLPGGYGRMTEAYDKVVTTVNDFLLQSGGPTAGSVQRLGAGWGGNVGGLVRQEYVTGPGGGELQELLSTELGIDCDLRGSMALPGEGACLLAPPEGG